MTFSLTEAAREGTQHGDTAVIPTGAHYLFSWDAIKNGNTTIAAGTAITTNGFDYFIVKQDIDPGSVVRQVDPEDFDSPTGRAYFKSAHLEDAAFGVDSEGTRQFTLGKANNGNFRATDLVTVLKVTGRCD